MILDYNTLKLAEICNDIGNAKRYKVDDNKGWYFNDKGEWELICSSFEISMTINEYTIEEHIKIKMVQPLKLVRCDVTFEIS